MWQICGKKMVCNALVEHQTTAHNELFIVCWLNQMNHFMHNHILVRCTFLITLRVTKTEISPSCIVLLIQHHENVLTTTLGVPNHTAFTFLDTQLRGFHAIIWCTGARLP